MAVARDSPGAVGPKSCLAQVPYKMAPGNEGPFGIRWFWWPVAVILCLATAILLILLAQKVNAEKPLADSGAAQEVPQTWPDRNSTGRPVVAFLGDSYTAGDGLPHKASQRWSKLVSNFFGWQEDNFGIGDTGYSTAGVLAGGAPYYDRVNEVASDGPAVVVVSGGRNDQKDDETAIWRVFTTLREELPDATIIGVQPMFDAGPYPPLMTKIGQTVDRAVTSVGGIYIPLGNPLQGRPSLIQSDHVHPNAEGHQVLARAIESALSARLPKSLGATGH